MSSETEQFQRDLLESVKQMRAGTAAAVTIATSSISLTLPVDVIERWKQTGPDWQTRMAELLSKAL